MKKANKVSSRFKLFNVSDLEVIFLRIHILVALKKKSFSDLEKMVLRVSLTYSQIQKYLILEIIDCDLPVCELPSDSYGIADKNVSFTNISSTYI